MKLFLTVLALWLSTAMLSAQEAYDLINLKNGSFYKGNVTEYIPNDHATIKLLDGRIITVNAADISGMTIADNEVIKKNFDIKQKGYFHNSLIGPQFGKSTYGDLQTTFAFDMVNGYKIKGHHMGIGLGMEIHAGKWYMPLYADYMYQIFNKRFSPIVGVNGGFMIPLEAHANEGWYGNYEYTKGGFVGGRIGFVVYSNSHFAFQLNLTYRYIHLDGAEYNNGIMPFANNNSITGSADLHRIGVMLGFLFN